MRIVLLPAPNVSGATHWKQAASREYIFRIGTRVLLQLSLELLRNKKCSGI
jgi:hypothetical protein